MLKIIANSFFGVFGFAATNDEVAGCSEFDLATNVVGETELALVPGDQNLYVISPGTIRGGTNGSDLLFYD